MEPLSRIAVDRLVPHARPMLLLDALIVSDGPRASAVAAIRPSNPFLEDHGVPAFIGLEYLAQTVAAHGGYQGLVHGKPVRGGFLLGTKKMALHVDDFPLGMALRMNVEAMHDDGELLRFHGQVIERQTEQVLVEGDLTIFQPEDMANFMTAARQGNT